MRVGDRDGHGFYGQLSIAVDGRLLCHECGRTYLHLGTHAQRAHGLSSAQYRAAHGLELTAVDRRCRRRGSSTATNTSRTWTSRGIRTEHAPICGPGLNGRRRRGFVGPQRCRPSAADCSPMLRCGGSATTCRCNSGASKCALCSPPTPLSRRCRSVVASIARSPGSISGYAAIHRTTNSGQSATIEVSSTGATSGPRAAPES